MTDLAEESEKVLRQTKKHKTKKHQTVSYATAVRYISPEGEEDEGTLEALPVSTGSPPSTPRLSLPPSRVSTSDSELDEFLVTEQSVNTTYF